MDLGIKGRVAVVTGGASGIGFATAALLLREGARVVASDGDLGALDAAVERLAGEGEVIGIAADLVDVAHAQALEREVAQRFGQAEILVHAAGSDAARGGFDQLTDDDWRRALDLELLSAVRVLRAFLPHMRRAQWGRVVLIGADDAVQPSADALPYGAAKAAILHLAKGLSKSLGAEGILVNAVSPAVVAGGAAGEEIAAAVAFLCSERAGLCAGANLRVDGGSVATV